MLLNKWSTAITLECLQEGFLIQRHRVLMLHESITFEHVLAPLVVELLLLLVQTELPLNLRQQMSKLNESLGQSLKILLLPFLKMHVAEALLI